MIIHSNYAELGEIVDCLDSLRIPVSDEERQKRKGDIPYYGANGRVGVIDKSLFDEKLLLLSEDGGSWGPNERCAYIISGKSWVNNHAHVLRCRRNTDIRFLMYFLNYVDLRSHISGTTRGKLNQQRMNQIKVFLPEITIQRKIAKILTRAEATLEKRRQTLRLADEFLKSAFLEMFGDPQKKKFRWEIVALGDADISIIDGDRGSNYPKQNEFFETGYCLFLNTKNVTKEGFSFESRMFISQEKDSQLKKGKIGRNDLILTTRGTVGNVAIYDDSVPFQNVRINSGMVILRPNLKALNLTFLYHLFKTEYIKNQISSISSGCAQPQLPISSLKQLRIFIPNLPEQQKFVDLVQKVERLKEKQKQSETQLQNLFNSLMQRAFNRELLTT